MPALTFQVRTHFILSLFFLFYHPEFKIRLLKNLAKETNLVKFYRISRMAVAYKRFNCFLPDPIQNQMKTYFATRARQSRTLKAPYTPAPRLATLAFKAHNPTKGLYSSAKTRYRRTINYRKMFKLWQRNYYRRIKYTFYSGKSRPREVRRLLQKFIGKRLSTLTLHFKLHPIALLGRIFPFFDRFLIKSLIEAGVVCVNYQTLKIQSTNLHVGDFLHLIWSPRLYSTYKHWLLKHRYFIYQMAKGLRLHHKALRRPTLNRRKNYYRKLTFLPNLYRRLPSWLEVNYLTLSAIILHTPQRPSFVSFNFNPYLNRLLGF